MQAVSVVGNKANISLLEKMARKLEPAREELDKVKPPPKHSRDARMIKAGRDIPQVQAQMAARPKGPSIAQTTGGMVKMKDNEPMAFFNDGSLRHAGGRIKGKKQRKQMKRLKHEVLNKKRHAATHQKD